MTPIGYLVKKKSSEIEQSSWGIQFVNEEGIQFMYPDAADDRVSTLLMDRMGESGIKWTRIFTSWHRAETAKGQYEWDWLDKIVYGLTERGVNIYLETGFGSNTFYHDFPAGRVYPPVRTPEMLDGYCAYVNEMANRYNDVVSHYDIYNEPNLSTFWTPRSDVKEYGLMVQRVGEVIHSVNKDAKVITDMGGVGGKSTEFMLELLRQPDALEQIDILTYHSYGLPEPTSKDVTLLREGANKIRQGLPIWRGEGGCPSSGDSVHTRGTCPWGYNIQSKWLLRCLLTDLLNGVEVSTYFLNLEFYHNRSFSSPESGQAYNTKGLTQYTTWAAKPAHYALQNPTATVDSACEFMEESASIEVLDPGIFYGIGAHEHRFPCTPWQIAMRKNGVPMLAYWLPWQPQEIIKPATVRIALSDVSWKEPVCVDLLSGEVHEAAMNGSEIEAPLADYPMILTEHSLLDLADKPQQPSYDEIISKLRWTF